MTDMINACQIVAGDMIDLEGDKYADPDRGNVSLQCQYMEAALVEQETPECTVIGFEGFDRVGFPTHHKLKVVSLRGQRRTYKPAPTMGAPSYD